MHENVDRNRKNYWKITHDMTNSRIYKEWIDMKSRCYNENCGNFKHYGARGIKVCDEWIHSFETFYEWAMNNGYDDSLTIDRIDNDGNYEPSNCRYVNKSIQNINKRHKNTSGYVGICKCNNCEAWYGRVKHNKKCYYTGISKNIHEAARMRNEFIIANGFNNKLNVIKE